MSTVISVENVSKQYRLGEVGTGTLSHDVNRWWHKVRGKDDPYLKIGESNDRSKKGDSDYSWALRDVSFEVKQGEVLGIIGRNGAGKSTLLKILSRVTTPTTGEIKVKGRIASLLEVGTGFHPELTGRENIFLNGAILGMRKHEITRKLDEIIEFSGCERYIDTPVKRYSSGMYVRLAFAVAAHLEPEILIIDEVLAVGDAEFQKKCLGKMKDVAGQGRTVLFVSHNMGAVSDLTGICAFLENGRLLSFGTTSSIVKEYLAVGYSKKLQYPSDLSYYRREASTDTPVLITGIRIKSNVINADDHAKIAIGEGLVLIFKLECKKSIHGALISLSIKNTIGEKLAVFLSLDNGLILDLKPGFHEVSLNINSLPLAPGEYLIDVGVNQSTTTKAFDVILDYPLFSMVNKGQVQHWLDRPWGYLHSNDVVWGVDQIEE